MRMDKHIQLWPIYEIKIHSHSNPITRVKLTGNEKDANSDDTISTNRRCQGETSSQLNKALNSSNLVWAAWFLHQSPPLRGNIKLYNTQ